MTRKFVLVLLVAIVVTVSVFALAIQRPTNQIAPATKLNFANSDLAKSRESLPIIRPIAISSNRLLVPTGDVLYMLDDHNKVVWEYSVEPELIYDVSADSHGSIYLAISDGHFKVLDLKGDEIWGNFMNGRAQYSQIAPYKDGLLVVLDMEGYRQSWHDPKEDDRLEFWQNQKRVWTKNFPKESRMEVWGDKILSVKQTNAGKEVSEIR
jgi:hypothetical protein